MMRVLAPLLLLSAAAHAAQHREVHVKDGHVAGPGGAFVGTYTSQLTTNVLVSGHVNEGCLLAAVPLPAKHKSEQHTWPGFHLVSHRIPRISGGFAREKRPIVVHFCIASHAACLRMLPRSRSQDKLFEPVSSADWENISMVNASVLRYLVLDGDYLADVPLRLPSLFVLQLASTASIKPAANLSLENTTTFTGLVEMNDVRFSAVLGGTVDASSLPAEATDYPYRRGYQAVAIKGGSNNAIRHVQLRANNSDGAVGINQSPHGEIAHCDIGGGPGGQGMTRGRCVWCLATSHALVHDNWVRNCSSHSLDFDAFTSSSAAYNNLCEDGIEEGIFVRSHTASRCRGSAFYIIISAMHRALCSRRTVMLTV
jgi:hypothetical protein